MTMQEFEFVVQVINNNTYERILFDEIMRYAQTNGMNVCDLPYYEFIRMRNYLDRVHRYRVQNLAYSADDYASAAYFNGETQPEPYSRADESAHQQNSDLIPNEDESIQERPYITRLKESNRKAKEAVKKERSITAIIAGIFIACVVILICLVNNNCQSDGLLTLMMFLTVGFFLATVVRLNGMKASETAFDVIQSLPEEAYKTAVANREALRNTNAAIFAANIHHSRIESLYKRITK